MKLKILIGLLLLVATAAATVYLLRPKSSPESSESATSAPTTSGPTANVPKLLIGDPSAKLTIVEYGDFQCPICQRFFRQTEPQLRATYIDSGKAKIEFRVETHIGAESVIAAEAAYCAADQNKFPAYHDQLYQRQSGQDSGVFSNPNLKQIARELGLDQATFDSCLDSGKYHQTVIASDQEAQSRISGTPTFFIGDKKIVGAQPFEVFKTVIDAQSP